MLKLSKLFRMYNFREKGNVIGDSSKSGYRAGVFLLLDETIAYIARVLQVGALKVKQKIFKARAANDT